MIVERVNAYSTNLQIEPSVTNEVQQYIVRTEPVPSAPTAMQVETAPSEPDQHSISNDSEVEFSDAISDFPSTSFTQRIPPTIDEPIGDQSWQSVVPSDWVSEL